MSRTNSYSAIGKPASPLVSATPGRLISTKSTPASRSAVSAASARTATPGSRSSQQGARGTPRRSPRRLMDCKGEWSPLSTASSSAQSRTLRASGPPVSRVAEIGAIPTPDTRPTVGRSPTTPHSAAGTRTEPPVSVPIAAGTSRAATAALEPPLLPPGMHRGSHGLCTAPLTALWLVMPKANSCMPSLPAIAAPAARSRCTSSASAAGALPCSAPVPTAHGQPTASMLSFSAIGMPSSGSRSPAARRWSADRACARSASASKLA